MPRGAKKAIADTRARNFRDGRSFVSQDKHDYLYGKDKISRFQSFIDCTKPYCAKCGKWLTDGEIDHIQGGLVGRCDCLHNLQWLCPPCHRAKHVQVQWTRNNITKLPNEGTER